MPDGTRRPYPSPIPFGVMKAGQVNAWAAEQGGNWPIHCAALMMRTASVRALGGWTAIPGDDELATFAALSEVTDGYYDQALTWLYRQHPKQMHRTAEAQERSATGRASRCSAPGPQRLRALGSRPAAAAGFAAVEDDMRIGPGRERHEPARGHPRCRLTGRPDPALHVHVRPAPAGGGAAPLPPSRAGSSLAAACTRLAPAPAGRARAIPALVRMPRSRSQAVAERRCHSANASSMWRSRRGRGHAGHGEQVRERFPVRAADTSEPVVSGRVAPGAQADQAPHVCTRRTGS